jgi:hypothetical protein
VDANKVKEFVEASGLKGADESELSGSTTIGELDEQTLSVTVTTTTDDEYTYDVTFKKVVLESAIDEIISDGITDVQTAIDSNSHEPNAYATLGTLGTDADNNKVTVTITKGNTQVTRVYVDIVQKLVEVLNDHADVVANIKTDNDNVLDITGGDVNENAVKVFVEKSGLKGAGGSTLSGTTQLSALDEQTLSVIVTTTCGETYTYNVNFVLES